MNNPIATPPRPALSIPPIIPMLPIIPTTHLAPSAPPQQPLAATTTTDLAAQTLGEIMTEYTDMWRDFTHSLGTSIQAFVENPCDPERACALQAVASTGRSIRQLQDVRIGLYRVDHPGQRIPRATPRANTHNDQRKRDTAQPTRKCRKIGRTQEQRAKEPHKRKREDQERKLDAPRPSSQSPVLKSQISNSHTEDQKLKTENRVSDPSFAVPTRPIRLIRPILPIAPITPGIRPKWDPTKTSLTTYLAQLEASNNYTLPQTPPPRRLPRAERRLLARAERRRLARLAKARHGPAP